MPIDSDNTRMTLDFSYSFEGASVPLRFHHTEDMGPTVTIFLESESGIQEAVLPAGMFAEVADFLRTRNLLAKGTSAPMAVTAPVSSVALPVVSDSSDLEPDRVPFEMDAEEKPVEDDFDPSSVSPIENLGNLDEVHSGVMTAPAATPSSDEILAERQAAAAKAHTGPRVKRT